MHQRKAAIPFILLTAFIDSVGFGIIIPVIPKLIETLGNCNESEAATIGGWMLSLFALAQFIFSPILGNLSDKFGRRPILLLSLVGFGIDYLILAYAPTLGWLYAGRIIAGVFGASYTTATAYISDISTPAEKSKNYGLLGAAFGLGFIIGPVVGALLSDFGMRAPFIAGAVLAFANAAYGYFILPESLGLENRREFKWKNANPVGAFMRLGQYKMILNLLICFFLLYLAAQAVMSTWQYYTEHKYGWMEKEVGFSLGVVGITVAIVQGLLVRVVNPRIGNPNAVIIGFLLYSLGMLSFAFAPTGLWMLLASIPYCLGGINGPAMQSLMSNEVAANSQGELQGLITSVQSLTSIFGPVMMTSIFKSYTDGEGLYFPGAPYFTAAVLIALGLIIAFFTVQHSFKLSKAKASAS